MRKVKNAAPRPASANVLGSGTTQVSGPIRIAGIFTRFGGVLGGPATGLLNTALAPPHSPKPLPAKLGEAPIHASILKKAVVVAPGIVTAVPVGSVNVPGPNKLPPAAEAWENVLKSV